MIKELRKRLGIDKDLEALATTLINLQSAVGVMQIQIQELRAEVTRLSIAQYVPPVTPEPERKIIKTRNFKEYLDILEQEQSREHSDAS